MIWFLLALAVSAATPSGGSTMSTADASITLHLRAPADAAFPLFDPVNERRWSPDWHPTLLGDARVASGLVFTTEDQHGRAAWLLDRYEPQSHTIRYVAVRTSTLTTIDIAVVPAGPRSSVATVRYRRTALDAHGAAEVVGFAASFPAQGPHWEAAINAALDAVGPP
jgi:hypothetical protein